MRSDCSVNASQRMKVAIPTLKALLERNVLEIKFLRRRAKANLPPTRRMLCTNDRSILTSEPGKKLLRFQESIKPGPKYNPMTKNIVIAWDIMVQDYRCVSGDDCEVLQVIEQAEDFWTYYNDVLYPMTPKQKTVFMMS